MRLAGLGIAGVVAIALAACTSDGGSDTESPSGAAGPAGSGGASTGAGGASTSSSGAGGSGAGLPMGKRPFSDSSTSIAVLADQLPGGLTDAQRAFVVGHFVGTQKLTLADSQPLRALAPNFLVLHYHLAIWQSVVDYIIDGNTWGNDLDSVSTHEAWFWHNEQGSRVQSVADGKYLMNIGNADFLAYWKQSFTDQVKAGDYDGVFADSASPDLLQWEAQMPPEPRLQGTGARDTAIAELGGQTYIEAWQSFMQSLDGALAAEGIALIPNTGSFTTSWDTTNYGLTAGIFSEGYGDPMFAESDWKAATNEILSLVAAGKIAILQNYLGSVDDVAKRLYLLGNYLLVKGSHTYVDYFASGPLEWYPEWKVDLGAAMKNATTVDDLASAGVYRRDFAKGFVLLNPSGSTVHVDLGGTFQRVDPSGGGPVDASGAEPGTLGMTPVTAIDLGPTSAALFLD